MTQRVSEQPAWLLHQRPWQETGALIDFLTPDYGRISLIARGVRSGRSKRRGELVPFQALSISWSGRGDLPTLSSVEAIGDATFLMGTALSCGFYVNELTLRLMAQGDVSRGCFAAYSEVIQSLAHDGAPGPALRAFELRLLAEQGYALDLTHAEDGAAVLAERRYVYDPERGLVETTDASRTADWRPVVSGDTLLALADKQLRGGEQARQARRLLEAALRPHLGDRPLRSRELLR
ncbi:MAG: DNA repair protein RecO [Lysobacteraceae bacterium]|nr:MAG: DNA repair protein RecO [Xanthomonadaceae bacterium]